MQQSRNHTEGRIREETKGAQKVFFHNKGSKDPKTDSLVNASKPLLSVFATISEGGSVRGGSVAVGCGSAAWSVLFPGLIVFASDYPA